jgi:hypothetical protein
VRTAFVSLCHPSHMRCRNKEHHGGAAERLQAFQAIAHDRGFANLRNGALTRLASAIPNMARKSGPLCWQTVARFSSAAIVGYSFISENARQQSCRLWL